MDTATDGWSSYSRDVCPHTWLRRTETAKLGLRPKALGNFCSTTSTKLHHAILNAAKQVYESFCQQPVTIHTPAAVIRTTSGPSEGQQRASVAKSLSDEEATKQFTFITPLLSFQTFSETKWAWIFMWKIKRCNFILLTAVNVQRYFSITGGEVNLLTVGYLMSSKITTLLNYDLCRGTFTSGDGSYIKVEQFHSVQSERDWLWCPVGFFLVYFKVISLKNVIPFCWNTF